MSKVIVDKVLFDKLLSKSLPPDYEVLLSDYDLNDAEHDFYKYLIFLININTQKVIDYIRSSEFRDILVNDSLSLGFWSKIEPELRRNMINNFDNVSELISANYGGANKLAYGSLNLNPIITSNDLVAIEILKRHTFDLVDNLITDINKNIKEVIWRGVKDKLDIDDIVNKLVKIGLEPTGRFTPITRAEMIAVTEISRIVNTAKLQCYKDNGITEVNIVTAHDSRVCPICLENERNNPYKFDEAIGMIPTHPRCRCVYEPVLNKGQSREDIDSSIDNYIDEVIDLTLY